MPEVELKSGDCVIDDLFFSNKCKLPFWNRWKIAKALKNKAFVVLTSDDDFKLSLPKDDDPFKYLSSEDGLKWKIE